MTAIQLMDYVSIENLCIDDYKTGYHQLVDTIIENNADITKIKSAISEILKEYYDIFNINHRALFYRLLHHAPLAIFVLLTFEEAREFYLPVKINVDNDDALYDDIECNHDEEQEIFISDKAQMYNTICSLVGKSDSILGEYQHKFSGVTDGYWNEYSFTMEYSKWISYEKLIFKIM